MRMNQIEHLKRLILEELHKAIAEIGQEFAEGTDYGSHANFRYMQGKSCAYLESTTLVEVAYKKLFKEEEDEDNEGDV